MKKQYLLSLAIISIAVITVMNACKKTDNNDPIIIPVTKVTASIEGVVTDVNNSPVSGATVKGGAFTAMTDADGHFKLKNAVLTKDAGFVNVSKAGYFTGTRTFIVNDGATSHIKIRLISKTGTGNFSGSSGGSIAIEGGGDITIGSGSVVSSASGIGYSGNVTASAVYLNPADANFREMMPGDLRGIKTNKTECIIKSFGIVSVELNNSTGEKLQLASAKTAAVTIPIDVSLQASAPSSIAMWYFDETNGLWKEEGTANRLGNNYIFTATHFSFWNAGTAGAEIKIDATFKSDTTGLAYTNKQVIISSDNFGTTSSYTDNSGMINGLVPANEILSLKILNDCGGTIYSTEIGPFSADTSLGTINLSGGEELLVSVTLTGTLVNCSSSPVTSGYVQVTSNSGNFYAVVDSGNFSITYTYCNGGVFTPAAMVAYDSVTDQHSASTLVNTSGGTANVGEIRACNSPSPIAAFTYSGNLVAPATITFTNTSTNALRYSWNFGDGDTSDLLSPVHIFAAVGDYTVTLSVTGDGGTNAFSQILNITNSGPAPVAAFNYSGSMVAPATITFTNFSTDATSYVWYFGDGGDSSIQQNPSHTFLSPGTYTVSLTAIGTGGIITFTQNLTIIDAAAATYINISLNGTDLTWTPDTYILSGARTDTGATSYTSIKGDSISFPVEYILSTIYHVGAPLGNVPVGNYPFALYTILGGKTYNTYYPNFNPLANVTEYGAVDGYITGTASGWIYNFPQPITDSFPFTCSFRVKRTQ